MAARDTDCAYAAFCAYDAHGLVLMSCFRGLYDGILVGGRIGVGDWCALRRIVAVSDDNGAIKGVFRCRGYFYDKIAKNDRRRSRMPSNVDGIVWR